MITKNLDGKKEQKNLEAIRTPSQKENQKIVFFGESFETYSFANIDVIAKIDVKVLY